MTFSPGLRRKKADASLFGGKKQVAIQRWNSATVSDETVSGESHTRQNREAGSTGWHSVVGCVASLVRGRESCH